MGKWLEILKTIGPMVVTLIPGLNTFAPTIVAGIAEAERLQKASGPEKKAHVVELVRLGATAANAGTKKETINVDDITKAASSAIDAVVSAVNAVHAEVAAPAAPGPTLRTE